MSGLNQTVCRYFSANGHCYYGEQCNFLHEASAAPRLCRNLVNDGFCKNEGKGCEFSHSLPLSTQDGGTIPSLKAPKGSDRPLKGSTMAAQAPDFVPADRKAEPDSTRPKMSVKDAHFVPPTIGGKGAAAADFVPNPDYFNAFPSLTSATEAHKTASQRATGKSMSTSEGSSFRTSSLPGGIPEYDPTGAAVEMQMPVLGQQKGLFPPPGGALVGPQHSAPAGAMGSRGMPG
eukprot:CAMPEP_0119123686 /NCGR_PEP_ID=MMETSP1310-20130426/3553_1 /TAXON_ID=464262 /ORGANISM="Genus nov. species nov., Strain RCC2339" /LENGTH=231 /DNA_ID=CAMNT_0007113537 /DNA_START=78 /DNA_END=770 /DNA_ORIENTATION=+